MLEVSTSQLSAYTYPRVPSAQEIAGPPSTMVEPVVSQSSTDPATLAVLSILNDALGSTLKQISLQISVVSTCMDTMESHFLQSQAPHLSQDHPYSPSALAALWAPNPTNLDHLSGEEQNSLPHYWIGQPNFDIDYDMAAMEQANYSPPMHPDFEPVPAIVKDFYRRLYNVDPNLTILSSSQESELHAFNENITMYSSDILGYKCSLPWDNRTEHQFCLWRAATIQSHQLAAKNRAA